jgi:uncharacterized protein DUF4279
VIRLKVRQYVYVAISSSDLSADEVGQRLGMSADRTVVAGSRGQEPLRPPKHSWHLVCDQSGLTVDEQIADLIERLQPVRAAIKELTFHHGVSAVVQVVRYFNDEEGEEEDKAAETHGLKKLEGQHQLLGWHLSKEVLEFLTDVRAELDIDEYS